MITAAIILAAVVIVTNAAIFFAGLLMYRREKRRFIQTLQMYFEPRGKDEPSEFTGTVQQIAGMFAQAITQSIKGMTMGMQSVDSKNVAKVEGDLIQDLISQKSPLLGMLASQFPALTRRLQKNPHLLPLVEQAISKVGAAGANGKAEQPEASTYDFTGGY